MKPETKAIRYILLNELFPYPDLNDPVGISPIRRQTAYLERIDEAVQAQYDPDE
jgi:hypothetical protein